MIYSIYIYICHGMVWYGIPRPSSPSLRQDPHPHNRPVGSSAHRPIDVDGSGVSVGVSARHKQNKTKQKDAFLSALAPGVPYRTVISIYFHFTYLKQFGCGYC